MVLEHSRQPCLLKPKLLLDYSKRMLSFGADMRFGSFDQIIQSSYRGVWQMERAALLGSHHKSEADTLSLHLWVLLDPFILVISSVGVESSFSSPWRRSAAGWCH